MKSSFFLSVRNLAWRDELPIQERRDAFVCVCICVRAFQRQKVHPYREKRNSRWTDRGCEQSSVLAAGGVGEAADVGFVDGVQEWAVSLDEMDQCGLELASGKDSGFILWHGSQKALLSNCWLQAVWLCLSEDTRRKEHSGGNSGWYPLGGNDLELQHSFLTWRCCGWVWNCAWSFSGAQEPGG